MAENREFLRCAAEQQWGCAVLHEECIVYSAKHIPPRRQPPHSWRSTRPRTVSPRPVLTEMSAKAPPTLTSTSQVIERVTETRSQRRKPVSVEAGREWAKDPKVSY
jgi:hypothetical protein